MASADRCELADTAAGTAADTDTTTAAAATCCRRSHHSPTQLLTPRCLALHKLVAYAGLLVEACLTHGLPFALNRLPPLLLSTSLGLGFGYTRTSRSEPSLGLLLKCLGLCFSFFSRARMGCSGSGIPLLLQPPQQLCCVRDERGIERQRAGSQKIRSK